MKIAKLAGVVAATAVTFGLAAVNAATASATDSINVFGVQEQLNGPNGLPYIGYTVGTLAPSSDPVPHNGRLYAATLKIDGFGGNYPPFIERFGARAQSGDFYPSIWGASNAGKLYFDVVGDVPNSVVWNDGVRDILAWVPGQAGSDTGPVDATENSQVIPDAQAGAAAPMPAEGDAAIVATPNDIASSPYQLNESEVAQPGFNGGGEGGRR
ncbi:DUF1942 domain-containing protein [Mycobacterium sp. M26]|uniref:DUF1942 domain-containing protein n=1 Tax=Mycobacterium sp. M26 TaxID=1762962 RepID=UPI0009E8E6DB|nr:DUF1942 domain-containing protein [Mycobacterium sp. M26]